MPYVVQGIRDNIAKGMKPASTGTLNYAITKLVLEYLPANPRYADYNTVVGVLESAKLEFYRRACAPYENQKAHDNGDVYEPA